MTSVTPTSLALVLAWEVKVNASVGAKNLLDITPIPTPFVLNVSVNCYLVNTGGGFVLIDSGRAGRRAVVEQALLDAGCKPGSLKLILVTHGDFDHCGNAAYLRQKFGGHIALHQADVGMVERGDMTWNRRVNPVMKFLFGLLVRLRPTDRFTPDVFLTEDSDLSGYGLDAKIISLPGHSKGNVGILTAEGDLFCGDLLANVGKPDLWSIIDDRAAAQASLEKLKTLTIHTVYPGHGQPFSMAQFRKTH